MKCQNLVDFFRRETPPVQMGLDMFFTTFSIEISGEALPSIWNMSNVHTQKFSRISRITIFKNLSHNGEDFLSK